jgi:hypothetical protein
MSVLGVGKVFKYLPQRMKLETLLALQENVCVYLFVLFNDAFSVTQYYITANGRMIHEH